MSGGTTSVLKEMTEALDNRRFLRVGGRYFFMCSDCFDYKMPLLNG